MMFRSAIATVALAAAVVSAPAVYAQSGDTGERASQCFVLYKMAAASPANAAHRTDIERLGQLMARTMQDSQVSKKQFDGWTGELLARIGAKDKVNPGVLAKERDACNAFAKARYTHYAAKK